MSEANKTVTVAFYQQALLKGDVENAFRAYAGPIYRQHNPLIEDGMEGVRKFVAWIMANHPDAHGEIKRVFADGDYVILHSHWHGLSDNPRGQAVVDIFRLGTVRWWSTGTSSSRFRKRPRTTTQCSEVRDSLGRG